MTENCALDTAGGLLFGKLMCMLSRGKFNPLIGASGIAEEDLIAEGAEEMTLEEYVDVVLFILPQMFGAENFELLSRQRTVNAQGLPVQIIVYTAGPGGILKASRLIYVHENKIGFNATYIALKAKYPELEPLIEFSFSTFRVR